MQSSIHAAARAVRDQRVQMLVARCLNAYDLGWHDDALLRERTAAVIEATNEQRALAREYDELTAAGVR